MKQILSLDGTWQVIYDHDSGRWFLLILAINSGDLYSYYLLAVSDDSDPHGTWMKYALDSTLNGEDPSNNWSDYPGLGACADVIYITANMFDVTVGGSRGTRLWIVHKDWYDGPDNSATVTINDPYTTTGSVATTTPCLLSVSTPPSKTSKRLLACFNTSDWTARSPS